MRAFAFAVMTALAIAVPAAAQAPVGTSDIQRLQDSLAQASSEVSQLRSRDAALAGRLQSDLDELREEVIYLKVKLRKERSVPRADYTDVRDRLDDLRSRATATPSSSSASPRSLTPVQPAIILPQANAQSGIEIPVGTELDVRLIGRLNSGIAKVEDRFEATTLADLILSGRTVIPAGVAMRGVVTDVQPATRTNRTGKLTVSFDQMTINGRAYPIRATVSAALQSNGMKGEVGKIGAGSAAGAIIGGILGGGKGAILGAVVGGGGTIAATEGKDVDVPQGTTLRVRFDSPVTVR